MAQNVTIMGASYSAVPAVTLPKTGGGTARFDDASVTTATASDVASGKVFVAADGTITTGTGSGGDNSLIVTLSWDDDYFGVDDGAWVPDCTWAEVSAAAQAGKEICVKSDEDMDPADGYWEGDPSFTLWYCVVAYSSSEAKFFSYALSQDGLALSWYDHISLPTGTINITQAGNTDVTQYATASVPYADWEPSGVSGEFITTNNQRKWRAGSGFTVYDAGWITAGWKDSYFHSYSAVPANTTVTPSTSAQTVGGANYMMEGPVTVAAMPTGTAGTPTATKGSVSNHSVSVTPSVTNTTGYITGSTKTGTAVSVTASELVSGTYTVTGSGTHDVTNYASASVASGGATASATKGAVSNHTVTVTPSVTRTAGWVTAGTASGTAVTVSASELVSGSQTVTQNGTVDVTNLASVVVDVQGGSGDLTIATATSTPATASHAITFTGLSGEPTSFHIVCQEDLATASQVKVAAVSYDGTDHTGQTVTNTSNAQASFDDGFSHAYSNGTLTVTATTAYFQAEEYALCYTYGGGSANIGTKDVQVGSGATSITFTGLSDEPSCWSCVFTSNFSTSSGYTRVMAVANDGTGTYGIEMGAGAQATEHWTATYSNGSLTITSQGTNAGGYFHQPGNYHLTYAVGGKVDVTIEALTVTQNGTYAESGKAYSPVTVNVSGGGSVQFDTKTVTGGNTYPTSLEFTSMKGEPKAFVLRLNAQVSSSGSTTYYYIVDVAAFGTTTHGNCFRIGSTRRVDNITSGYSWSYSGGTLTITSSAASRSASPGAFYNGSYELLYAY